MFEKHILAYILLRHFKTTSIICGFLGFVGGKRMQPPQIVGDAVLYAISFVICKDNKRCCFAQFRSRVPGQNFFEGS